MRKGKIVVTLSLFFLISLLLAGCAGGGTNDGLVWDTYTNSFMSIKYPGEWGSNKVVDEPDFCAAIISEDVTQTSDELADGDISESDLNYLPMVYIRNQKYSENRQLPTIPDLIDDLESDIDNFNEASCSSINQITVGGKQAVALILIGPLDPLGNEDTSISNNIKMKAVIIPNYEDDVYNAIVYYTTIGKYNEKIDIINEMIDSIQF